MKSVPKWLQYVLVLPIVIQVVVKTVVAVYDIVVAAIKSIKKTINERNKNNGND